MRSTMTDMRLRDCEVFHGAVCISNAFRHMDIRSSTERNAAEILCRRASKQAGPWDISARARSRVCDLDPRPPTPPAILRRLRYYSSRAIGSFGLALGEIYLPRGNMAAVDRQAS